MERTDAGVIDVLVPRLDTPVTDASVSSGRDRGDEQWEGVAVPSVAGVEPGTALAAAVAVVLHRYGNETASVVVVGGDDVRRVITAGGAFTTVDSLFHPAEPDSIREPMARVGLGPADAAEASFGFGLDENGGVSFVDPAGMLASDSVARLAGHLQRVLDAMADLGPDARATASIGHLPLLTDGEMAEIEGWNDTTADYPLHLCFADAFEAQVDATPEAVAMEDGQFTLTYAQVDEATNHLASSLVRAELSPDSVVGLVADRTVLAGCAIVAAFKAGVAYAPLDGNQPPARLASALTQAGPEILLVDKQFHDVVIEALTIADLDVAVRPLDDRILTATGGRRPIVTRQPADLAYILTTSGSTGVPKAAMVEQVGMMNHAYAMIDVLDLDSSTVMAQTAALSFDVSVWQIVTPLLVGGRVAFAPDEARLSPEPLFEWLHSSSITVLQIVPSLMATVLRVADDQRLGLPSSLQWVIPTGEALPPDVARRWLQRFPTPPLVNAYGPAECADDVTLHFLHDPPPAGLAAVPIGTALSNVTVDLVDANDQPVPVGVVGELTVGGIGVGRGYRNDPERTAEVFDDDPRRPGGRRYHTGDLGRRLPDGSIVFEGRRDFQVKLNGRRIELGEVEAAIIDRPRVDQALVVQDGTSLTAYVIGTDDGPDTFDRQALRSELAATLPRYLVPRAIVPLAQFPLNPNGKVDRKRLPEPGPADLPTGGTAGDDEAVSATEIHLARIWGSMLDADPGRGDDFFDLGGSSLDAAVMLWEIKQQLGVDLPLTTPIAAPTLAELARVIDERRGGGGPETGLVELKTSGDRIPLFLAPGEGGSALGFVHLSKLIGDDQPLFGLDLHRRREDPAVPQTLHSMSEQFIAEIKERYPEGPYILGGFCMGGDVALEMAKRMRAAGDDIPLVVMLQNPHPLYENDYPEGTSKAMRLRYKVVDRIRSEVRSAQRMLPEHRRAYLRRDLVNRIVGLITVPFERRIAKVYGVFGRQWMGSEAFHQNRWAAADANALVDYAPSPYDGDVMVIRASIQPKGVIEDPTMGWRHTVTGNLILAEAEGLHLRFLWPPSINSAAAQLRKTLDAVNQATPLTSGQPADNEGPGEPS
ncbi:MAG: amino acid adenylation domain-containing protein [Actinomycetota bacterium]